MELILILILVAWGLVKLADSFGAAVERAEHNLKARKRKPLVHKGRTYFPR